MARPRAVRLALVALAALLGGCSDAPAPAPARGRAPEAAAAPAGRASSSWSDVRAWLEAGDLPPADLVDAAQVVSACGPPGERVEPLLRAARALRREPLASAPPSLHAAAVAAALADLLTGDPRAPGWPWLRDAAARLRARLPGDPRAAELERLVVRAWALAGRD